MLMIWYDLDIEKTLWLHVTPFYLTYTAFTRLRPET
jgi:hypothetical protein